MDQIAYSDLRAPFTNADYAAVTLLTTNLPLYPAAAVPLLPGNYWAFADPTFVFGGSNLGKCVRIKCVGRITTGITPGNGQFALYLGNGTAANGTLIVQSAAFALIASQTNLQFEVEIEVHCRLLNVAGSVTGLLFGVGKAFFNPALVAAGVALIPGSAPAVSPGIDLTIPNNVLSLQLNRSGSTAETAQLHTVRFYADN